MPYRYGWKSGTKLKVLIVLNHMYITFLFYYVFKWEDKVYSITLERYRLTL